MAQRIKYPAGALFPEKMESRGSSDCHMMQKIFFSKEETKRTFSQITSHS